MHFFQSFLQHETRHQCRQLQTIIQFIELANSTKLCTNPLISIADSAPKYLVYRFCLRHEFILVEKCFSPLSCHHFHESWTTMMKTQHHISSSEYFVSANVCSLLGSKANKIVQRILYILAEMVENARNTNIEHVRVLW